MIHIHTYYLFMTTVILYYNRVVLHVNFKLCIANFVNSKTLIFCYESQLRNKFVFTRVRTYYVISQGGGEYPNDYASVTLTQ